MPDRDGAGVISIRRALPSEEERAAALIYGVPSAEAAGIAGGPQRAAALSCGLFLAGVARTPGDDLLLAFRAGRAVGALLGGASRSSFSVSSRGALRALALILRLYAPWELPGLVRRTALRGRLDFPVPRGSYHVVELQVEPESRGLGIGTQLLRRAEARAREHGCTRINLTTSLTNPARRLYEREGYTELARRTIPGYETLTGTPGRVFLDKPL
jgi:ribosomal protein S18 acetylase RimI-like enzyme